MPSVDPSVAYRVLADTRTFRGQSFKILSMYGKDYEEKCFRVETLSDGLIYKVRFPTATSRQSVAREYLALSLLSRQGLKWTPRLNEVSLDEPSYLIIGFVDGESLDKSLKWIPHAESIMLSLQQELADIHCIRGEYFGHLAGPRYESWQGFFEIRLWRHVMPLVEAHIVSERDLARIKTLHEEARQSFSEVSPTLLHADVKPANVIFELSTRKTTLIDFELSRFGDPDFEWTKLRRMAIRWREYEQLVSQPLLSSVAGGINSLRHGNAKMLLYDIYHACSFLDFELETGVPVAPYRFDDIAQLLTTLRSRIP
jgi:aminoglycoside phosphotransferase (APT) family kinase protein